ncbi:AAA family ATPase [Halomicrobium mukohataei]|uniref:AAA family ATPase n=1 Tax=Halomicrobium mukohataei TaxID=57705 RepID=A0A847UGJ1_9EURY|nr:AAA family ATPase [Halomicrobium mukohataei]NLV10690.1 AAA family ATPase [Halomicrobium mukohataei]
MKITDLTIVNFRPYYGKVTIEPETDAEHPLALVRGKNDSGKTSLFTAIRFCLYGADNRADYTEHINRRAVTESDGKTRVEMTFLHDGDIFTIERGIEYSQSDDPDDRRAASWYREVRGPDGPIVEQGTGEDEYRMFINRVLPENVSRFFFFDAEELQQFEQSHDSTVRESIETVLGIQEIENAISDLEDRKKTFDREYADYESTASEVEEYRKELREVIDELDSIGDEDSGEIAEIQSQVKERQAALRDVREQLDEIENTEPLREKKEELKDQLEEDENDLEEALEGRNELRKKVGPMIAARGRQVFRDNYDIEGSAGEADFLHELVDRDECVCGESMDDDKRDAILNRYQKLKSSQRRRLTDLMEVSQRVDLSIQNQLERYNQYQATIRRLRQSIEQTEEEIDDLQQQIDEIEETEKAGLKERESELREEISDLEQKIGRLEERRSELQSEKTRLENRIAGMDEAESEAERLRELSGLSERCRRAFADIKDELVESRRESVQEHASETFLRLTNRPEYYQGLEITDNYELQVKTPGATRSLSEQDPSAGQTQIIAYSFIAGLSKYTTRNAPVVIDTPIGRLDPEHKANLVDYYHEFSDQVMILYQPNELSQDDLEVMREYIASHFEISIRNDDSSCSTIERLPDIAVPTAEGASQ